MDGDIVKLDEIVALAEKYNAMVFVDDSHASGFISLTTTNLVPAEVYRLILHRVGVIAASLALDRIESSARVSIAFASGPHHAAARAWLAKFTDHRVTYADAVGFAVIEDVPCIGFLSFDSDFLLAGFHPLTQHRRVQPRVNPAGGALRQGAVQTFKEPVAKKVVQHRGCN